MINLRAVCSMTSNSVEILDIIRKVEYCMPVVFLFLSFRILLAIRSDAKLYTQLDGRGLAIYK